MNDRFLLKIVAKVGFSSSVEFFLDDESPLISDIPDFESIMKPQLVELRKLELGTEITLPQELIRRFRVLSRVEQRISRVKYLTSILSVAPVESIVRGIRIKADAIILMNAGDHKRMGYFAYRVLSDGGTEPVLVGCLIGGTVRSPVHRIAVYGKPKLMAAHPKSEEAWNMFKEKVSLEYIQLQIPEELSWSAFFGFSEKVIEEFCQ
jgi:hypothetical protein